MSMVDFSALCISPDSLLQEAITAINKNEKGIILITDDDKKLIGTITDGDIRRAVLAGKDLNTPISDLLAQKRKSPYPKPISAHVGADHFELRRLMKEHVIHQLPIVDSEDHVIDLVTTDDLLPDNTLPIQAVIMAGGVGARLYPLTNDIPKPMLPIGDRPLMELLVEQLQKSGIRKVNITTHYLADKIMNHFGDGQDFGIKLNYINEDHPLGTAGALGLMDIPSDPLLVINGDILTRMNFRAMLEYHRENDAVLTVAVRKYELNVPYGVIESDGPRIKGLVEKPVLSFFVNAGIYLLEPAVYQFIPNDEKLDMTDIIQTLLTNNQQIVSFPIVEYCLDIGQQADYEQAQEDIKNGRLDS